MAQICEPQSFFDTTNSGSNIYVSRIDSFINADRQYTPSTVYSEYTANDYDNTPFSVEIPVCGDIPLSIDKNILGDPATTNEIPGGPVTYEVIMELGALAGGALDVAFADLAEVLCSAKDDLWPAAGRHHQLCRCCRLCPSSFIAADGGIVSWGTPGPRTCPPAQRSNRAVRFGLSWL